MFEFNATLIVAMISFVVFMLIMNAILYRPILNMIKKRESYINSNYEDSKNFDKSAQEFKQTHEQKLKEAQEKCRQSFKDQINKAQDNAATEVKNAKEASKIEFQNKKNALEEQENLLKENLKNSAVKDLALIITQKITNTVKD